MPNWRRTDYIPEEMCDEAPCSDWDVYFVVKAILDHCQEVEEMLRRERPRGKKKNFVTVLVKVWTYIFLMQFLEQTTSYFVIIIIQLFHWQSLKIGTRNTYSLLFGYVFVMHSFLFLPFWSKKWYSWFYIHTFFFPIHASQKVFFSVPLTIPEM